LTQRASVEDMALPSKLTSYLGAAKPIVASVSGNSMTATELSASGAGYVVRPDNAQALLEALLEVQSNAQLRSSLAQRARSYYETELDPDVLRTRFVKFVEGAVSGSRDC
jgi:glycosyltransferase involved in cell wall biosynthesis